MSFKHSFSAKATLDHAHGNTFNKYPVSCSLWHGIELYSMC